MGERFKWTLVLLLMLVLCMSIRQSIASAQGTSNSYRIDESFFGPGGNLDSSSTNYQFQSGQQSVGNTGVVEGSSTNYRVENGYTTTADPRLSCVLNTSTLNFGNFSTGSAITANATFSVLNYTAYGYIVSVIGSTPANNGHNLAGINPTDTSHNGTEQFGINLVANTSPATFGSNPVQVPSSTFSFGSAATNYNTANNFRYVNGETIASAPSSSGETDFTISYIVNASTTTPGGKYSGNQVILCTGTY